MIKILFFLENSGELRFFVLESEEKAPLQTPHLIWGAANETWLQNQKRPDKLETSTRTRPARRSSMGEDFLGDLSHPTS